MTLKLKELLSLRYIFKKFNVFCTHSKKIALKLKKAQYEKYWQASTRIQVIVTSESSCLFYFTILSTCKRRIKNAEQDIIKGQGVWYRP